jgi:hypothetical protein
MPSGSKIMNEVHNEKLCGSKIMNEVHNEDSPNRRPKGEKQFMVGLRP